MDIVLIKQTDARLDDKDGAIVRQFLFGAVDGVNDRDKRAWRGFWRAVNESPFGEYFTVSIKRRRSGPFHRLSFAVMQAVFKGQERFDDFKIFRNFVKIGAGFVDYIPDVHGELHAVPKSVSFDDCSEEEMRQFHDDSVTFLRTGPAQSVLWPQLSPQMAEMGVESILNQFER